MACLAKVPVEEMAYLTFSGHAFLVVLYLVTACPSNFKLEKVDGFEWLMLC
jgi:hypothetical protein